MATFFSEHFVDESDATTPPATVLPLAAKKARPGIAAASIKTIRSRMDFTVAALLTTSDEIRLFTLQSGDMVNTIRVTTGGTWTAADLIMDLGLFDPGVRHDGVVLDADLFADALDIAAGLARVEALTATTGPTIFGFQRGLFLWEMLELGAGTDTVDPKRSYDFVLTPSTVTTLTVQGSLLVEVEYTPAAIN